MCGRYSQAQSLKDVAERFKLKNPPSTLVPRWNIAPAQEAAVILREKGANTLTMMRWGLVPSWAADLSIGSKMINARAESVAEKPSYKRVFRSRRCLIPADAFYEWAKDKTPYRFHAAGRNLFAFAGLWDAWESTEGNKIKSFTIITTSASPVVKPVHGRMPVILPPEKESYWLDPEADTATLLELLAPFDELKSYPVSPAVNSPSHEGAELAKPVPLAQPEFWG